MWSDSGPYKLQQRENVEIKKWFFSTFVRVTTWSNRQQFDRHYINNFDFFTFLIPPWFLPYYIKICRSRSTILLWRKKTTTKKPIPKVRFLPNSSFEHVHFKRNLFLSTPPLLVVCTWYLMKMRINIIYQLTKLTGINLLQSLQVIDEHTSPVLQTADRRVTSQLQKHQNDFKQIDSKFHILT